MFLCIKFRIRDRKQTHLEWKGAITRGHKEHWGGHFGHYLNDEVTFSRLCTCVRLGKLSTCDLHGLSTSEKDTRRAVRGPIREAVFGARAQGRSQQSGSAPDLASTAEPLPTLSLGFPPAQWGWEFPHHPPRLGH